MTGSKKLIVYHGGCVDGFTAAWVATTTDEWEDAELFAASYTNADEVVLPNITGRDVLMLDFSLPRLQMLDVFDEAESFLVLDHHKSAQEACDGLGFCIFDMERSGAGLAWDVLHPGKPRPWLVDYVEDRDLWRFRLTESKAVNAFIGTQEHSLDIWDDIMDQGRDFAVQSGSGVIDFIDYYVRTMKLQAYEARLGGEAVLAVNAPYVLCSELLHELCQERPFAVSWFQRADGKFQYSLRSDGKFDVSAIAKTFGGGGHRGAAGFVHDLPLWVLTMFVQGEGVGMQAIEYDARRCRRND